METKNNTSESMYETEKRPIDTENKLMVPKGEDRARDKLGFGD